MLKIKKIFIKIMNNQTIKHQDKESNKIRVKKIVYKRKRVMKNFCP